MAMCAAVWHFLHSATRFDGVFAREGSSKQRIGIL